MTTWITSLINTKKNNGVNTEQMFLAEANKKARMLLLQAENKHDECFTRAEFVVQIIFLLSNSYIGRI